MTINNTISSIIGNTPLINLSDFANGNVVLLGKYEAKNPGGSVKDRIARSMIEAAEKSGQLKPGGTIIEPTSGNTGVALAMLSAERDYHMILVMPETMSIERRKLAASYGARIVLTPRGEGMKGAIEEAHRLQQTTPNSTIMGQFENPANPEAHYCTTGPEIWRDTNGAVDVLIAGMGTGGTISGTAKYLKEQNPALLSIAVEPAESPVLNGGKPGPHKIQGIGAGFIPQTYNATVVDEVIDVKSEDAIALKEELAKRTGLLAGISSGAALAAAQAFAQRPDVNEKVVVVILPDTGERYLSLQ